MVTIDFKHQMYITLVDKGLLAIIVLAAGYYLNKSLEGIKNRLSRDQEFWRTVNAAVVDLTTKLAAGSHLISWLAWSATQPDSTLELEDFKSYDADMRLLMSELVGSQVSLAALNKDMFETLNNYAKQLYDLDICVGEARDLFVSTETWKIAKARVVLRDCCYRALRFDEALLTSSTGLLQNVPLQ